MTITAVRLECVHATPALAEFLIHLELADAGTDCAIVGVAHGPKCPGLSTVSLAYPMSVHTRSDHAVSLLVRIPEPNLWSQATPFTYTWSVSLARAGQPGEKRVGTIALKGLT